jgi:hypothetical protein
MMDFMSAGRAADAIINCSDEARSEIVAGILKILKRTESNISAGAISNALLAGCSIVSSMGTTLRVPTKEDMEQRRKDKEEANGVKKPRLNGIGELQSVAKILNSTERLEQGDAFVAGKDLEKTTKDNRALEKRKRQREEFLLLQTSFDHGLTSENPHSVKSKDITLKKDELVKLFLKLGYESDFKKASRKKFVSLTRTEQADYLIAKLSSKDNAALGAEESYAATPVVVAQVLPAVTIDFQSWEEINEYFHGKYGYGEADKKESVPSSSDACLLSKRRRN